MTLRGLTVNGLGGAVGVDHQSGDALYIIGTSISGFTTAGISVEPSATASIFIRDSIVRDNGVGAKFSPPPSATGLLNVSIERTTYERNATGVLFSGNSSKGYMNDATVLGGTTGIAVQPSVGTASIKVDVRKSVVAGCTGAGASAGNGTAGSTATVSLVSTQLSENGTGIAVGTGGGVYATDSTIVRNGIGISTTGGGTAVSLHDNRLVNNTSNGAFSSTVSKL